jgi:hypothetical protein
MDAVSLVPPILSPSLRVCSHRAPARRLSARVVLRQATPQGHCHKRAEVGFKLAIKRLPAQCLDH